VKDYQRGFARVVDMPFGRQELTINIRPAGTLYKALVISTEGYAGDVPTIHQGLAVKAAIHIGQGANLLIRYNLLQTRKPPRLVRDSLAAMTPPRLSHLKCSAPIPSSNLQKYSRSRIQGVD
jgi:hypothetical protein